jgi:4-methylaminobutanoate oxidase (formaldehyde-forming)
MQEPMTPPTVPSKAMPDRAGIVIVGGGIVGCSIAYHLARRGADDVVLLEQNALGGGTTWHAAGLVGQLRATHNLTKLARYSHDLYQRLEAETGQATGMSIRGSLAVASDPDRMEELLRGVSMAKTVGVEIEVITPREAGALWPLLNTDDLVGAIWIPRDAQASPIDITMALAKGARAGGARIFEGVAVKRILTEHGRPIGVDTERGPIRADTVVIAAGLWSRHLAATAGVNVPLQACEHFYIVTEPIAGVGQHTPILRDPSSHTYVKEETSKLMVGFFEPRGKVWRLDGAPRDFSFGTLPEDWDHIAPVYEKAIHRVPALAGAGVQLFFDGPESFTPDGVYYLGEAPELDRCFVAAGFNSVGIQSAGGVGWVLADWILDGHSPLDLTDVDIVRTFPFQAEPAFLRERIPESLGLLYAMHWPFLQYESARGLFRSPLHDRVGREGAVFGETGGWERANWYAPEGVERRYRYSYGRQNWFEHSAREHRATREGVALYDQSSFTKIVVKGPDAAKVLDYVSANDVAGPVGRVVYTQWLNDRGGIEADLTITRLSEDEFLVVTAVTSTTRDLAWLRRHAAGSRLTITDISGDEAVISVMGPRSRELISRVCPADLSNQGFPFGTFRHVDIADKVVRAMRTTFVGELGWELYVPAADAVLVYDEIVEAGADLGLVHGGYHALFSCRIECGYRHFGHDIGPHDTPLEAGLSFAVAFDKPGGFAGYDAVAAQRELPRTKRLVQFKLEDPEPLIYHDEPIYRDGVIVGRTSSGMFGHTVGAAIGMGYVTADEPIDQPLLDASSWEIEVATRRIPATASLRSFYDRSKERIRM